MFQGVYSAECHPKYISGEWTEEQVFENWIDTIFTATDRQVVVNTCSIYLLLLLAQKHTQEYVMERMVSVVVHFMENQSFKTIVKKCLKTSHDFRMV